LVLEALQPLFIEEHLLAQSDFFSLTAPGAGAAASAVIAGQAAFFSAHEVAQLFFSPTAPGAAAAVFSPQASFLSAHFEAQSALVAQQSAFFEPTAPGAVVDSVAVQAARARTTDPRMAEMLFIGVIAP
jgi:hypothetical protein